MELATETTNTRETATTELLRTLAQLATAETFTVKRIGPEAAEAFRALPEFHETGCRFVLFAGVQVRIETKLNGVTVLARIN